MVSWGKVKCRAQQTAPLQNAIHFLTHQIAIDGLSWAWSLVVFTLARGAIMMVFSCRGAACCALVREIGSVLVRNTSPQEYIHA